MKKTLCLRFCLGILMASSVAFSENPLSSVDEIWKAYDTQQFEKALRDIHVIRNVLPKATIPDVDFLEILLAF